MIILPASVRAQVFTPRLIDHGTWNRPILGGAFTRTNRKGNRFAARVELPPIQSDAAGVGVAQDIRSAILQGLQVRWEQGALDTGSVGSPTVRDNDSIGVGMWVQGLTPFLLIPKGRFFSVTHDGRSYLHCLTTNAQAGASGETQIFFEPELRVHLSAGDVCDFETPIIQGVIDMPEWEWNMRLDSFMDMGFDLVERW